MWDTQVSTSAAPVSTITIAQKSMDDVDQPARAADDPVTAGARASSTSMGQVRPFHLRRHGTQARSLQRASLRSEGLEAGRDRSLRRDRFDDTRRRLSRHDPGEPKLRFIEQDTVLLRRPLLASGSHEHHHVEHFTGMRHIAGRKDHLDDEQPAAGLHCAPTVTEDGEALRFAPVVDDVRE